MSAVTAYFTRDDLQCFANPDADPDTRSQTGRQAQEKLRLLQQNIDSQLHSQNISLNVHNLNSPVRDRSAATRSPGGSFLVQYMRDPVQSTTVERLMGREAVGRGEAVEPCRHPVIELRLYQEGFAIELLLSPDAWWDQQNIAGKLSISRHRKDFYAALRTLDKGYRMGFWRGLRLSDMHIKADLFHVPRVMDEWLSTFEPGVDWFRVGKWYDIDDALMQTGTIVDELLKQIKLLSVVHDQIAWASDNNYRDFFSKQRKKR